MEKPYCKSDSGKISKKTTADLGSTYGVSYSVTAEKIAPASLC